MKGKNLLPKVDKEFKPIFNALKEQNWTFRPGGKHLIAISPSKKEIAISTTKLDLRGIKNKISELKRAGFIYLSLFLQSVGV